MILILTGESVSFFSSVDLLVSLVSLLSFLFAGEGDILLLKLCQLARIDLPNLLRELSPVDGSLLALSLGLSSLTLPAGV